MAEIERVLHEFGSACMELIFSHLQCCDQASAGMGEELGPLYKLSGRWLRIFRIVCGIGGVPLRLSWPTKLIDHGAY